MISHEHKAIFIHIPRTGGTSVEMVLAGNNWWKIHPQTKHIDWKSAKNEYAEYWDEYFKFSIVRNPWDWLASLYFSHERGGSKSWEEFVKKPNFYAHEQNSLSQCEIIGEEMNMVLRFETLHEDFIKLCRELGTEKQLPIIQVGEGHYQHYSELYTDDLKQVVQERHRDDIEKFQYKFISAEIAATQQYKIENARLRARVSELEKQLSTRKRPFWHRIIRRDGDS